MTPADPGRAFTPESGRVLTLVRVTGWFFPESGRVFIFGCMGGFVTGLSGRLFVPSDMRSRDKEGVFEYFARDNEVPL